MATLERVALRFARPFWPRGAYALGFVPAPAPAYESTNASDWAVQPMFSIAVDAGFEGRALAGGGAVLTFLVGGDSGDAVAS
jgi:hypothetical protein